ncbi:MAG: 3-phosphoshikimate 1-carboxyvinyltransferase [Candidatus Geothermincolia bacterium]
MEAVFTKSGPLSGRVKVPGDKSISHRAAIVGALARGTTTISNYSGGADCASTLAVLRGLGVEIHEENGKLFIGGTGGAGFDDAVRELDCGNSGTTMRLVAGAIAPFPVDVILTGDASLMCRPMGRVMHPLELMGAKLTASDDRGHPPLKVIGGKLQGIEYSPPVASAQVKSAVLLAGLGATGRTTVRELAATRDHTERMLRLAGIEVSTEGMSVTVEPAVPSAVDVAVPGDFSSAAFFLAAALMVPGSRVTVESTGLNPSRTSFLDVVRRMGAVVDHDVFEVDDTSEPTGDVRVEYSELKAIEMTPAEVAESIDEVTLVALLATAAMGRTVIRGALELRHKESDRIRGTVEGLRAMGAMIEETADGIVVEGPTALFGARVDSRRDHRLAMMLAVAGMAASGETVVDGWEWTEISYPGFANVIEGLRGKAVR